MSNAAERGWGPAGSGRMVLVPCPGIPLRVREEVAPLFADLVALLGAARRKHDLPPLVSAGGFNLRPKRGREAEYDRTRNPDLLSNHSWGLAADFNAAANPMGPRLVTDMPPETAAIAASCGLSWGGLWASGASGGSADAMHFEAIHTPAATAAFVAARARLGTVSSGSRLPSIPAPTRSPVAVKPPPTWEESFMASIHDKVIKSTLPGDDGKMVSPAELLLAAAWNSHWAAIHAYEARAEVQDTKTPGRLSADLRDSHDTVRAGIDWLKGSFNNLGEHLALPGDPSIKPEQRAAGGRFYRTLLPAIVAAVKANR